MAKSAGKKASNIVVWVILGLLVVALAGFGATNFGGSVRAVGQVGETEIEANDYARALQTELSVLQRQSGQVFPLAQARAFGIDRQVLQRLVADAALDNEAAEIGLSVGDEEVGRRVRDIPGLQGIDGNFDRDTYAQRLRQNGSSVKEFEETIRADAARTLLQTAVLGGAVTPPAFTDTLFNYARERRDFTWLRLGAEDLNGALDAPTEDQLTAYYEANPEDFTSPETKRLTYVRLSPDMLLDTIAVDEARLREIYDERIEEYVRPERRLVDRLVYPDQAAADAAKARLDAGELDFDALIAERDLEPGDVDIGDPSEAELGDAGAEVFALAEPGVVGPLETDLGPALFRVNAILSAQETTFEDVLEDLQDEYARDTARRDIAAEIEPIDDLLAGGATLEELAAETGMELATYDWVADSTEGIAAFVAFREAAAAVQLGDFPELTEAADGSLFALRLDALDEPALIPFEDVQGGVLAGWQIEETERRLLEQGEALAAGSADVTPAEDSIEFNRVGPDGSEAMAGEDPLGDGALAETGVLRDGFIEDAAPTLIARVFEMTEPGEHAVLPAGGGDVVVVRLDAINPADASDPDAVTLKEQFSAQTAETIAIDMLRGFTRAVEDAAGISINQTAINAVHAQFP